MIQTDAALRDLVQRAAQAPRIALDTEFVWERTFYPRLGIIQVGFTERECYLIDAVALPTLPHFGALLENPKTEKILHDAQQDLAILARITGATPRHIFDTRRAAGFGGQPSTASLMVLLRDVMNVEIPKTETRSNWLRRPLTPEQIAYALNDVRFLPGLREALQARAESLGNHDYLVEEMRELDAPDFCREISPLEVFLRLKSGRLRDEDLCVLLELVRWREAVARTRDRPRAHIIRDADLFALARAKPSTPGEIMRIQGLPRSASLHYAQGILDAVATGRDASLPDACRPGRAQRPTRELEDVVTRRIKSIQECTTAAGIDPALVASRATVTDLVMAEQASPPREHRLRQGWRRHFVT